ncbi:uncharacterized protein LOC116253440 [Nymphaea colorata]|nr:uncharacterized protein LOC116253440 [Nymphaea colorata]
MGNCVTSVQEQGLAGCRPAAIVINHQGGLLEFRPPTTAGQVVARNPDCFLCCAESMRVDSRAVRLGPREPLESGQMYFLLPLSRLTYRFTLADMCELAVRASSALGSGCEWGAPVTWSAGDVGVPVGKVGAGAAFKPILGTIDEAF